MWPRALLLCLLLGCGQPAAAPDGCPEDKPRVGTACSGERVCTYLESSALERLMERLGRKTDAGCAEVLSCAATGQWQSRGFMHCY